MPIELQNLSLAAASHLHCVGGPQRQISGFQAAIAAAQHVSGLEPLWSPFLGRQLRWRAVNDKDIIVRVGLGVLGLRKTSLDTI